MELCDVVILASVSDGGHQTKRRKRDEQVRTCVGDQHEDR